ncbi:copper chaperone PCu(A)C [Pyxidicoccus sp. 3LG]
MYDGSGRLARVAALLFALAGGCTSPDSQVPRAAEASGLRVEAARARLTPSRVGAVYLTLVNSTSKDDRLLTAGSTAAERTELHEVIAEGEVLRMHARPEGFMIPAGGSLELKPGGKHVMLYAVRTETAELDLTLHFERAGPVRLRVPVGGPGGEMP